MSITQGATSADELRRLANDHLWLHFTNMHGHEPPIIVRGDGCYLEDVHGKRYLDALAGLFSVNLGYGYGEEIGQAALEQMRELPFYTNWTYAHPRAIELAAEVASLAPGDLNRVFFVLGRFRGGRVGVEARAAVLRRARRCQPNAGCRAGRDDPPAGGRSVAGPQVQGDRPQHRLPRHDVRGPVDQRCRVAPHALRAARARGAAREQHEPLPPAARRDGGGVHRLPPRRARADDPGDGARDGLPGPHGADPERRRLLHRARGLLARRARALRPLRHPALGRRGDHRVRSRRPLVRVRALRHPAGHRHVRQGALLLVRGDRGRRRHRPRDGAVPRGLLDVYARDHVRRPSRDERDRAQEHRDHEAGADHGARPRQRGRLPRRRSRSCSTCRSSATCAEPASSTRSSW